MFKNIALINQISLLVTLIFLSLLAVIVADVTVTFIDRSIKVPVKEEKSEMRLKESEERKAVLTDFKDLFNINVFQAHIKDPRFFERDTKRVVLDARDKAARPDIQKPEETAPSVNISDYELYGTIVATPRELSTATIYNKKTKKFEIYGLKEFNRYIEEVHEIVNITRGSVEIKAQPENIFINLKDVKSAPHAERPPTRRDLSRKTDDAARNMQATGEGITKVSDNRYVIDQRLYQSLTKDVSSLMTLQRQISFIPKLDKERKPIGFEVRRITPGSLFQKIGLQRGDIVKTINGRVLNAMSVPEALQLLNEMKGESNIDLDFIRNNKESTIGYEVR